MKYFIAALFCLGLFGMLVGADEESISVEVVLQSGETIQGVLVAQNDNSVTVRRTFKSTSGTATADVHYDRSVIGTLTDLDKAYLARSAHAGGTIDQQIVLAIWCSEHGLVDRSAVHALKAIALDPSNESAKTLLANDGYLVISGKWVKEDDYLAENGLTRYQQAIVTLADRQLIREAQAKVETTQQASAKESDELARAQAIMIIDQKEIAADQSKETQLDLKLKDENAKVAQEQRSVTDLQKKMNAATQAVSKQSTRRGRTARYPSSAAQNAEKQAKQDYADAEALLAESQAANKADQQMREALTTRDQRLKAETEKLQMQLPGLTTEAETAKSALSDAKKAMEDVLAHITPVSLPKP